MKSKFFKKTQKFRIIMNSETLGVFKRDQIQSPAILKAIHIFEDYRIVENIPPIGIAQTVNGFHIQLDMVD